MHRDLYNYLRENKENLTKEEACTTIISFYMEELDEKDKMPTVSNLALTNTCAGLAMLEAGFDLPNDIVEYLDGRAGVMNIYTENGEIRIETFRDYIKDIERRETCESKKKNING